MTHSEPGICRRPPENSSTFRGAILEGKFKNTHKLLCTAAPSSSYSVERAQRGHRIYHHPIQTSSVGSCKSFASLLSCLFTAHHYSTMECSAKCCRAENLTLLSVVEAAPPRPKLLTMPSVYLDVPPRAHKLGRRRRPLLPLFSSLASDVLVDLRAAYPSVKTHGNPYSCEPIITTAHRHLWHLQTDPATADPSISTPRAICYDESRS